MSSFLIRGQLRGLKGAIGSTRPSKIDSPPLRYFPKPYTVPSCNDCAVIIPFFNPARSVRIVQNLCLVKHMHALAGIPTFYAECAFGSEPFLLESCESVFQYRSDSYMFYKENLIMLAEARLPPQFTKVVILDADVLFADADWLLRVSTALDEHDVIQPYKNAIYLEFDFTASSWRRTSCIADPKQGHTGLAWAFRRDWLRANPLCEYAIMGSGDTMLANTLGMRLEVHNVYKGLASVAVPAPKIGFLDMTIYHLPHGSRENRQYCTRMDDLMAALRFFGKPHLADIVERRGDGLLEWRPAFKEKLNAIVHKYFERRKDDATTSV